MTSRRGLHNLRVDVADGVGVNGLMTSQRHCRSDSESDFFEFFSDSESNFSESLGSELPFSDFERFFSDSEPEASASLGTSCCPAKAFRQSFCNRSEIRGLALEYRSMREPRIAGQRG